MKIVLTGGGTAGHVMPNIALVDELKKHFDRIYYVGSANGIEKRIAESNRLPFYSTTVVKFDRQKPLNNLKIPFVLYKGINEAKKLIEQLNPDLVFAKGGYCSLPIALAARKKKIPVVCHESDCTLGMANKVICTFSKLLITPYCSIKAKCPVKYIGLPIREQIFKGDAFLIKNKYDVKKPVLLAVGGSSGSSSLNKMIIDNIEVLTEKYHVIHITGKNYTPTLRVNYSQVSYVDNIEDYYAAADVVVTRGGAGALSELQALGKRCVVVPLMNKASRGDQMQNARQFAKNNNFEIINENQYTNQQFLKAVEQAYWSTPIKRPREQTNKKIVESIIECLRQ